MLPSRVFENRLEMEAFFVAVPKNGRMLLTKRLDKNKI